jgi:hypothetical protein
MRLYALAIAAAATLSLVPVSAFSQSVEIGREGFRIGRDRDRSGLCEELRSACLNKERLGEVGEGNCRRYRETCRRPSRESLCRELRSACLNKERLGEVGEGNCRRYRETCRGG